MNEYKSIMLRYDRIKQNLDWHDGDILRMLNILGELLRSGDMDFYTMNNVKNLLIEVLNIEDPDTAEHFFCDVERDLMEYVEAEDTEQQSAYQGRFGPSIPDEEIPF